MDVPKHQLIRANLDCTSSKALKDKRPHSPSTKRDQTCSTHPHHLEEVHDGDQVQQGEAKDLSFLRGKLLTGKFRLIIIITNHYHLSPSHTINILPSPSLSLSLTGFLLIVLPLGWSGLAPSSSYPLSLSCKSSHDHDHDGRTWLVGEKGSWGQTGLADQGSGCTSGQHGSGGHLGNMFIRYEVDKDIWQRDHIR